MAGTRKGRITAGTRSQGQPEDKTAALAKSIMELCHHSASLTLSSLKLLLVIFFIF